MLLIHQKGENRDGHPRPPHATAADLVPRILFGVVAAVLLLSATAAAPDFCNSLRLISPDLGRIDVVLIEYFHHRICYDATEDNVGDIRVRFVENWPRNSLVAFSCQ
ncbi:ATPase associated with various cellularactivities AAA_3 [Striga asiatica]|uniref:ATPase associated with various cellularactivities AAA_3 n=1 Tax=Striga asiatica TaxID=4170 RepID=A0A5A7QEY6_STRAF|nr:ATPase associated with various cellularactivities AAA_3 [Striga asiatica]